MTKTSLLSILIVLVICSCKNKKQSSNADNKNDSMVLLTVKPFEYNGGWGYDILADGKTYFHQDQVPAIEGKHVFLTKEDAQKTGNLVIQKLMQGKHPAIDSMDMVNAGIQYK